MSDKFGARKVMTFAVLWWSVFTAVTGAVGSLTVMLVARFFFGVGEGLAPSATWKALATWTPGKKRATANGIMLSTNSIGPALAPLFVVAIMAAWGWRAVFYALSVPGILAALWAWFHLPDNPADKKGITAEELEELRPDASVGAQADSKAADMGFFEVMAVPAVWMSVLIIFCSNTALWGFITWLPSYLVKARGFSMGTMGIIASLPFFAGFLGSLVAGWAGDGIFKNNRRMSVVIGQLGVAICLYLSYTATSTQALIIFQTLAGFIFYFCLIAVLNMPLTAVPKEIAGRAMGIVNTGAQAAGFCAPIIIGYLVQLSGGEGQRSFDTAFTFLIICALMASFLSLFYKQRPAEAAPAAAD